MSHSSRSRETVEPNQATEGWLRAEKIRGRWGETESGTPRHARSPVFCLGRILRCRQKL